MACRRLLRACSNSSLSGLFPKPPCGSASTLSWFTCDVPAPAISRWNLRCVGARLGLGVGPGGGWIVGWQDIVRIALNRGVAMGSGAGGEYGEAVAKQPGRFAVLTTGHAAEYCVDTYGGYGPMFITMLSDPGETWDEYFTVDGQFPSSDDLQKYDGFVVTGSRHDAHGDDAWIERLCGLLQRIHEMKKKSLCVCFGHQVVSRALGGKTGRASVGWEVGLRDVCLTDAFFSKSYGAGMPPKLKVLEVHRDQISEIPPGAEVLASSERTGVEIFAVGEHLLAIQGHPEFFNDVVLDLLDGRLAAMMTKEEIKLAKESMHEASADRLAWLQLCKSFLKGRKE